MRVNLNILFGAAFAIAGLRVLMAPYPNIEPVTFFVMATGIACGPLSGALLGLISQFSSDFMLGLYGPWTLYTSGTYALLGLISGYAGSMWKKWGRLELTVLAFALTITYDLITAGFWALQTMQPLLATYVAQVPFTLLHLSNCVFAFLFAPQLVGFLEKAKDFSVVGYVQKMNL